MYTYTSLWQVVIVSGSAAFDWQNFSSNRVTYFFVIICHMLFFNLNDQPCALHTICYSEIYYLLYRFILLTLVLDFEQFLNKTINYNIKIPLFDCCSICAKVDVYISGFSILYRMLRFCTISIQSRADAYRGERE